MLNIHCCAVGSHRNAVSGVVEAMSSFTCGRVPYHLVDPEACNYARCTCGGAVASHTRNFAARCSSIEDAAAIGVDRLQNLVTRVATAYAVVAYTIESGPLEKQRCNSPPSNPNEAVMCMWLQG